MDYILKLPICTHASLYTHILKILGLMLSAPSHHSLCLHGRRGRGHSKVFILYIISCTCLLNNKTAITRACSIMTHPFAFLITQIKYNHPCLFNNDTPVRIFNHTNKIPPSNNTCTCLLNNKTSITCACLKMDYILKLPLCTHISLYTHRLKNSRSNS